MLNNPFTLVGKYDVVLQGSQTNINNYLIKQLPKSTVFLDTKLNVVYASDSLVQEFNLPKSTILGLPISELFDTSDLEWSASMKACLEGLNQEKEIQQITDCTNCTIWVEYIMIPWYDQSENVIGIILQLEDVSNRILRELEQDKLKMHLREKSEIANIGSWEYDHETQKLSWCNTTKKIHEVADDYQPNIDKAILFYKEGYSRNTISLALFKALENKQAWNEKLQLITASGKEIWVNAAGKPLFQNGIYKGLIGTFQDITDYVMSETKTKESEHLLRTVIDSLPLNVYIKDLDSKKVLVNKSECDYLGVDDPKELLGKSDFDLYDKDMAQISRDEDLEVMEFQRPILGRETTSVKKDGTSTTFLTSKIPLNDDDDKPYGLLGISLDISDLKQKEHELRDLINVTSLQNKKLINFAHIVSHNLRSHSANFSMLLDFLVKEVDEDERENIIRMLTEASDGLLETLENLNEVVAISTNTNIEKKPVDLGRLITKVEQNLTGFLQTNKADIINEIPKNTSLNVVPAYMESILMNFITNAVKYKHPDREPIIRLSLTKNDKDTILSIEDNGMGIDLNKYGDKLFGMYKTFHNNQDARGIGLYITKNQIEAMNGRVIACSEVGEGTTFKIYFDETN
ncbi:PAS domain-containing protein [Muriicola sp. Z0-33]|uniref:PAS domain-containing protein n=1 Tax=Muriicola sp. Z0-33 TaxID=2816957 RepID=UPI0022372469|nr:PAS domain-containing protein [Muriicola sp. Z0-33]